MPNHTERVAALVAQGLTNEQAQAVATNRVALEEAHAAARADREQKLAERKIEHDRVRAMRRKPGDAPRGLPTYNATLQRWERE
jgi:hypothetical protein